MPSPAQHSEAIVLVKALPRPSTQKHDLMICCAAIEISTETWVRLYPISFSNIDKKKKFSRWDIVRFQWEKPRDDDRPESRRVLQNTLTIRKKLTNKSQKHNLLERIAVNDFPNSKEKTLILLQAQSYQFHIEKKPKDIMDRERYDIDLLRSQPDFFGKEIIPYQPSPYLFKYTYQTRDGKSHTGTCQDWEIDATFYRWSKAYGERKALQEIQKVFGVNYPQRGMALAMGTHSRRPDQWLINGVIRKDKDNNPDMFSTQK